MQFEVEKYDDGFYDAIYIWKNNNSYMAIYVLDNCVTIGRVNGSNIYDEEETLLMPCCKQEIEANADAIGTALSRFIKQKGGLYGSFVFEFGNIH